jgi:hypothetical protein
MNFRIAVVFVIAALSGCGKTAPMLEGYVILRQNVPQNTKKWHCTIILRNKSDHPVQVAPASVDYIATYTYWHTIKTDNKAMTVYSEPDVERDTSAKYPEQFVTIEPGGVIAIPMELVKLPEIADKVLDVHVNAGLSVYFEGEISRMSISINTKWSPAKEGTGEGEKGGREKGISPIIDKIGK